MAPWWRTKRWAVLQLQGDQQAVADFLEKLAQPVPRRARPPPLTQRFHPSTCPVPCVAEIVPKDQIKKHGAG